MARLRYSNWSLRAKVTATSVAITTLALGVVTAVGIFQMRQQIAVEQRRTADSVALGVARAAELPLAVGDAKELARLANGFLREPHVLFVAAYGAGVEPVAIAVRDDEAWEGFRNGRIDSANWILAQRIVETSAQAGEFDGGTGSLDDMDAIESAAGKPASTHQRALGHVVIALSTIEAVAAQRRQDRLALTVSIVAAMLGAMVLLWTLRSWMRRLESLAVASQAISRGDFSGSISAAGGDDELGRLARSFDQMRVALRERDGKLQQFTDTLQDQVRQRTQDLQTALVAAEEASKAKSLFLANMSHELRTPLNGVIGMVDLLIAGGPTPQQRRYCDIAKTSARSLLELINDILDFSKIEAGKLDLDTTDIDLHDLIENVALVFSDRAEEKKIELICGIAPDVPRFVSGDSVRLRQVLANLVSNAMKFTEKGEIVLQVETQTGNADDAHQLRFAVRDTGIGIPPDRLGRLFKSFSQVDASTTRKFGGTGLGLAISQRIVALMDGQIGVDSELGKGSTFWFTARFGRATAGATTSTSAVQKADGPAAGTSADPRGLRILAVDDNSTNLEIVGAHLSSWSMRPDLAPNAEQAFRMLRDAAHSGNPYRLAILDIHMPGTNGVELAHMIKSDLTTRDTILISLSSISDYAKSPEMAQHGFAACLSKPVLPSQLYNSIVLCLNGRPEPLGGGAVPAAVESRANESSASTLRLSGVHVLLAEDNEINRMVATELLKTAGCVCTQVVNGRQAVEHALSGEYDLILMDCQMPEMDGFEATRAIRDAEKNSTPLQHRPIVALTANAIKGDREQCLAAGMDGYVTKPIEPEDLISTIASLVQRRPTVADATKEASAVDSNTKPAIKTGPQVSQTPLPLPVDLPALERRCMGNRKLAAKLLNMFQETMSPDIRALTGTVKSGDAKGTAMLAHKIKGAAANVSAEQLRNIVAELEQLAKADALSQTQSLLNQLETEMERFREYVASEAAPSVDIKAEILKRELQ